MTERTIDNRGLEPPEPMMRVLAALPTLEPGEVLVALNDRKPMFLYPELDARGYRHQTESEASGGYRIRIWLEPDKDGD